MTNENKKPVTTTTVENTAPVTVESLVSDYVSTGWDNLTLPVLGALNAPTKIGDDPEHTTFWVNKKFRPAFEQFDIHYLLKGSDVRIILQVGESVKDYLIPAHLMIVNAEYMAYQNGSGIHTALELYEAMQKGFATCKQYQVAFPAADTSATARNWDFIVDFGFHLPVSGGKGSRLKAESLSKEIKEVKSNAVRLYMHMQENDIPFVPVVIREDNKLFVRLDKEAF